MSNKINAESKGILEESTSLLEIMREATTAPLDLDPQTLNSIQAIRDSLKETIDADQNMLNNYLELLELDKEIVDLGQSELTKELEKKDNQKEVTECRKVLDLDSKTLEKTQQTYDRYHAEMTENMQLLSYCERLISTNEQAMSTENDLLSGFKTALNKDQIITSDPSNKSERKADTGMNESQSGRKRPKL